MARRNIFRAIIFIFIITNINLLDAQRLIKIEMEDTYSDFTSQPTIRPEYLRTQGQSSEPVLVILVYFPDTDLSIFAKTTHDHWDSLFFENKKNMKDYFLTNSYGKLNLIPAIEGSGTSNAGIAGWYRLDKTLLQYKVEFPGNRYYAQIAHDAILASANDVDYAYFDNESNGNKDSCISSNELHIFVIVACYEERFLSPNEPKLRRCRLFLVDPEADNNIDLVINGKTIGLKSKNGSICMGSELVVSYKGRANAPTPLGFLAHEMGHSVGLPEHYQDPPDSNHAGLWCLMGAGDIFVDADYPCHICAQHKYQLGWIDPITIYYDQTRSLAPIETSGECLKLWENGKKDSQYFLVEYRKKQPPENYDCNLFDSGLLVWHVDKDIIALDKNKGVALERADNEIGGDRNEGNAGDLFRQGNEFLQHSSKPNSRKNPPDDDITGVAIKNIGTPGESITASFFVNHLPSSIHFIARPNFVLPGGVLNSSIIAYLFDTWNDTVESATDQISFNITQGQNHGSLVGTNPQNAQNGNAVINFQASSSPGTVTIEAASPGLNTQEADIFVFDLGTSALRFDGIDDYLEISDNSEPTQYTIEAWVKVFEIYDSNIIVRTGNNGPHSAWSHQLRIRDGKFEHYIWDGSSHELQGTTVIQKGNLYHVVGVASNNGMMRLFVNGKEEGNGQAIGTMSHGLDRYLIGSSSGRRSGQGSGIQYFDGIIYELRISTNIRYNSNFRPEPILFVADENTIGLFHFDEGSGQVTKNSVTGLSDGKLGSTSEQDSNDPMWINSNLLASPRLFSPEDNSVLIGSLAFRWEKENNAKYFDLQISPDPDFGNINWENSTIPGDATAFKYSAALLMSDLAHYCRINYLDYNNSYSEWSETRKFKLLDEFQGQQLIEENFDSGKFDFTLNGNASFKDGYILLVPNVGGQGGSIFYNEPFTFSSFEATFSAYFGERTQGADGLCFIWQANSPQALGLRGPNHGGCLGYEGIDSSYAIEFDTWHNGEHGDPSDNHIGFDMNGNLTSVATNSHIPVLEDNKWHDIRIRFENQTIYVWMDGQNYLDYEAENYDASKVYYFGFSAATGAAMNDHKIDNFILKGYTSTLVKEAEHHDGFMAFDYDISNYPNPFNNQTTIEFSLPQRQHVTIKIYNLLGQEVCSLLNSEQNAGEYKMVWNSEDSAVGSGLYFIELKVGKIRKVLKTIILK